MVTAKTTQTRSADSKDASGQDVKTTQQKREEDSTKSTESEEAKTDATAAASGGVKGAVVREDTGLDPEKDKSETEDNEDEEASIVKASDEEVKGAVVGTVRAGKEDTPYVFLTPDLLGSKVRTSDSDDESVRSWNVQTVEGEGDDEVPVALIPEQAEPGQTFAVEELPNVDVLKAAGIDPAQLLSGLPVRLSDPDTNIRPGGGMIG